MCWYAFRFKLACAGIRQLQKTLGASQHVERITCSIRLFAGEILFALTAGTLEQVLNEYTAPVFTLRWNKRGDLVITGSADPGTKVLDADTWLVKQTFTPHSCKGCQCMPACHCARSAATALAAHLPGVSPWLSASMFQKLFEYNLRANMQAIECAVPC
jgi:hypothetical protein